MPGLLQGIHLVTFGNRLARRSVLFVAERDVERVQVFAREPTERANLSPREAMQPGKRTRSGSANGAKGRNQARGLFEAAGDSFAIRADPVFAGGLPTVSLTGKTLPLARS
jgi:hypothetical protein